MTTSMARNGAVEIAYRVQGAEDGRPLLLISGGGAQMIHWPDKFVAALLAAGFRVAMFDNRDCGRSTSCRTGQPYTLADLAADAVAVLDALAWPSAHLAGISLGGMIGQELAVHHGDRVRSLTSMSSAPGWGWRISRPRLRIVPRLIAATRPRGSGRESAGEMAVRLLRVIGSPGYPFNEDDARDVAMRAYDIAHDPSAMKRQLAAIKAGGDRRAELAFITAPTLVVHGEADPMQSLHAGRATAAAIHGARLLTFAGVGHDLAPPALWPALIEAITALADQADGRAAEPVG